MGPLVIDVCSPTCHNGVPVAGSSAMKFDAVSPANSNFPAVLSIHLTALNANGKAYAADKVYQLTK